MREYWGTSLRFMLALGLLCASSVARADLVRQHIDDDPLGVTIRLTDFAELQPSLLDSDLPSSTPGSPFYEPRLPQSPRDRFASVFMPDWDTYAASYSGRQIDGIDLTSLLADAPAMLGHFHGSGMSLDAMLCLPMLSVAGTMTEVPVAGSSGRTHVGENNKALTQDRMYLRYNHYHRVSSASVSTIDSLAERDFHLDSFTLAAEKTFYDGIWSLETRMPVAGQTHFSSSGFSVTGGNLGNLALILKRMICLTDRGSLVAGLGVDVPTGSTARGNVWGLEYTVSNEAVHLLPYLGFLHASENRFFANGFVQLDIPVNSHSISIDDAFSNASEVGKFHEQTLLHLDLSVGRWLMRAPESLSLTGLALLTELHYTTTLNDSDSFSETLGDTWFFFHNRARRTDLLNLTIGFHTEWRNNTLLRVGSVFPLRTGTDRTFDSELQVQLERRF